MVVKLLGGFDVFTGIIFLLYGIFTISLGVKIIPDFLIFTLGIILLLKGLIFVIGLDVVSFLDIISAIVMLSATSVKIPLFIYTAVSIFLIQKGIFSLLD